MSSCSDFPFVLCITEYLPYKGVIKKAADRSWQGFFLARGRKGGRRRHYVKPFVAKQADSLTLRVVENLRVAGL